MQRTDDMSSLEFRGPVRIGECDVWEAVGLGPDGEDIYSCIALCRRNWRNGCPALGGTRWVETYHGDSESSKEDARHQAIELATSMYVKNAILSRAAAGHRAESRRLFEWQGGKGVIWTPPGVTTLSEHRLRCHGKLIHRLGGEYYGSKDAGIGTPQLEVIAEETPFVIGLRCAVDTGEGTAHGVHSGIVQSLTEMGDGLAVDAGEILRDVPILVVGAGKVGLPLVGLLHSSGAKVFLYDDHLDSSSAGLEEWYQFQRRRGAAVGERHRRLLFELSAAGRVFARDQEVEALSQPEIRVVSPNGGPTEWLSREALAGGVRANILVRNRYINGNLRLILGAGNDQVSMTNQEEREQVLSVFDGAGITFVPDFLVSPGGVIAVSHEREDRWLAASVNADARELVGRGVKEIFREARLQHGHSGSIEIFRTLETILGEEGAALGALDSRPTQNSLRG